MAGICVYTLLVSSTSLLVLASPGIKYRAAVVELTSESASSVFSKDDAQAMMLRNVAAAGVWAAKAADKGAQIVVFSEDYADSGWGLAKQQVPLFAETLPEPGPTSLCTIPQAFRTPVASALACIAKKHGIVLVTGLIDTGPCVTHLSPFTKQPYPCSKVIQRTAFNSQAAFGSDGQLLAKYHKSHLARSYRQEYEPQWAQVDTPDVVSFESHFGVKFGMFICNDVNFGGPTRALLKTGIRDFVFSTFWINSVAWFSAVGMQDAFARTHGANFLASNADYGGRGSSGSGIWPANTSAAFPQHYNTGTTQSTGWMGIADLTSPEVSGLPEPMEHPKDMKALSPMDPDTLKYVHFKPAQGQSIRLNASAKNVSCSLDAEVKTGGGSYALVALSGFESGWYMGGCIVVACEETCNYIPTGSIQGGGAVFSQLELRISAPLSNTFMHTALCSSGEVVTPRSALTSEGKGSEWKLNLSTDCELLTTYFDSRAQSESEAEECPAGGCPRSNSEPVTDKMTASYGGMAPPQFPIIPGAMPSAVLV